MRSLSAGSSLGIGQVRRHGRKAVLQEWPCIRHDHRMYGRCIEHSVADLEGYYSAANFFDDSGKLLPKLPPVAAEASKESHDEWLCSPETTICPIHRRRVNLDEHLVVFDRRLSTSEIRTTSGGPYLVDCCLHRWTVATGPNSVGYSSPTWCRPSVLHGSRRRLRRATAARAQAVPRSLHGLQPSDRRGRLLRLEREGAGRGPLS